MPKLIVLYPPPTDVDVFERRYRLEHAPMVLKNIPGWIVQGRFDVVTPMESAWKLKTAWPEARFEVVWDAGHASTEPGIVDALVRATDQALKL